MKAHLIALGAAAATLALVGTAEAGHYHHHGCFRAAGVGEAVTRELAAASAKDQLALDLTASGAKAKGHAVMKCKYEGVVTKCKVSTRACK